MGFVVVYVASYIARSAWREARGELLACLSRVTLMNLFSCRDNRYGLKKKWLARLQCGEKREVCIHTAGKSVTGGKEKREIK